MIFEAPLESDLTRDLFKFWVGTFGEPLDLPPEVFLGAESEHNRHIVYLTRRDGRLAGTCALAISSSLPALGGFGEVATDPQFRRIGIATELCRQAVEDFRTSGGQALFLGTDNADAARLYRRLGWRKLAGANVMANTADGASPEEFLGEFFRGLGPAGVHAASPFIRIPIIPLLVRPHDWHVLDANVDMFSTRYAVQNSCMGLYRRYDHVTRDGKGAWFGAVTGDARAVGLSTARLDGSGGCNVDGFVLSSHIESWAELVKAAMNWCEVSGASVTQAVVAVEDEEKKALFESMGFVRARSGEPFRLGGREIGSEILQLRES